MASSSVWSHFEKVKDGKKTTHGRCNKCKKLLLANTFGLKSHLKTAHGIDLSETATLPESKIQPEITEFFPKLQHNTLQATLASLVVEDSITFYSLSKSKKISSWIAKDGLGVVPKSPNTIREYVLNFANEVKEQYKVEINQAKLDCGKLSLAFDEWTSNRNRRYLNLLIYNDSRFWNLGLIRILGKTNAHLLSLKIEERLLEFDFSFSDFAAIISDGAPINLCVARETGLFQQLCIAHGVQLAVEETLYSKSVSKTTIEHVENSSDDESDEEEENSDELGTLAFDDQNVFETFHFKDDNFKNLINKVRKTVKLFRKSPVQNDDLQVYVKEEINKVKQLTLDSKTRWNSLIAMLKRFFELRKSIQLCLLESENNNFELMFSTEEYNQIESIIETLSPLEELVKVVCKSNTSLYEAYLAIDITLDKLSSTQTKLSKELKKSLIEKLRPRFSDLFLLQVYFENMHILNSSKFFDFQAKSSEFKSKLYDTIYKLLNQGQLSTLNKEMSSGEVLNDELGQLLANSSSSTASSQSLSDLIKARKAKSSKSMQLDDALAKEINHFEQAENLGPLLSNALRITKTLRPTTIDSERAFSVAGSICTKVRSSFKDNTLDNLCILKGYFNNLSIQ